MQVAALKAEVSRLRGNLIEGTGAEPADVAVARRVRSAAAASPARSPVGRSPGRGRASGDDDELRQIVAQEVSVQQELAKIKRELNDI